MRQIHRGIRTSQAEDATKPFSAWTASVIASKTIRCQEPLTSLQDDIAATKRILDLQPGPCILVAHSYGGTVITEAGTDPHVIGLVYIAAHEPDAGETEASNSKRFPSATSKTNAIEKTPDGYTYLDPAAFPEAFAADLPPEQAEFEAHSQVLTAAGVFTTPVTDPAWKVKPSWALVADADKIINPDLKRFYAARSYSQVVEATGASHSVYPSRPKEVAALIEEAAPQAALVSSTGSMEETPATRQIMAERCRRQSDCSTDC